MPSLRIVLDPEQHGLGLDVSAGILHLADDAEIVISGLPDGMVGGRPSMMFGFRLPDGRVVIAETSWKLFSAAYMAFAGKFGVETPDASGIALEYDATGSGQRVRLDLVPDDAPQYFECELCGDRIEREAGRQGAIEIVQFVHRHFREKHPGRAVPNLPEVS